MIRNSTKLLSFFLGMVQLLLLFVVTRTKFTRPTIHLGPPIFHLKGHIIGAVLQVQSFSCWRPSYWSPYKNDRRSSRGALRQKETKGRQTESQLSQISWISQLSWISQITQIDREKERKETEKREKEREKREKDVQDQLLLICIQFSKRKTKFIGRKA